MHKIERMILVNDGYIMNLCCMHTSNFITSNKILVARIINSHVEKQMKNDDKLRQMIF